MGNHSQNLVRQLGLLSASNVVIGSVIGSGIFLVASDVATSLPSPSVALGIWLVAAAVNTAGGLIFAELGAMFPVAGGHYVYLVRAFGPLVGFLFGWTLALVIQAGSIAALAIAFAIFLSRAISLSPIEIKVLASAATVILTLLNCRGVSKGSGVLNILTLFKMGAILFFVIAVLLKLPQTTSTFFQATQSNWSWSGYGVALIAAFWAFDGWNNLSFVSGEVKNPKKNIPLAFVIGLGTISLLYLLLNLSYYLVLSPQSIASSSFVAADAAQALIGQRGSMVMCFVVALSALGCLNGLVLSGARVLYAMAVDNALPPFFGKVNPRTHTPNGALLFQLGWSLVLIGSGTYSELFTYVVFGASLFYALTALAVIRLRRKDPERERPYRVPFYPWLPILYLTFTVFFSFNALMEKPRETLAGIVLIALGIPVFVWFQHSRRQPAETPKTDLEES